jgi:hypothetical protein
VKHSGRKEANTLGRYGQQGSGRKGIIREMIPNISWRREVTLDKIRD